MLLQVCVRDSKGAASQVPAHAASASASEVSASPQQTGPDSGRGSGGPEKSPSNAVIRPEAWTRVWASGVASLRGPVRVTDIIARIGPDTAIVWTLANFPAGLPLGILMLLAPVVGPGRSKCQAWTALQRVKKWLSGLSHSSYGVSS